MPTHNSAPESPLVLVATCSLSPKERLISARQQINALFGACNLQIVDGYIETDPIIDTIIDRRKMALFTKRPMTRSEIATYATHRLTWETLLQSEAEYALVLEDDFQFVVPQTVKSCFDYAGQFFATGCDIVKLFDFPKVSKCVIAVRRSFPNLDLIKWERPHAGMVAYLISRKGAEKLLSRKTIFRVVDEDTKFYWELGLDIWSVPGNPVTDASANLGGSLLENDRLESKKRSILLSFHGLCLAIYRSAKNASEFRKYRREHNLKLEKMVGPEGLEPPTKRL
jgi:glycosyl transferase, family 25